MNFSEALRSEVASEESAHACLHREDGLVGQGLQETHRGRHTAQHKQIHLLYRLQIRSQQIASIRTLTNTEAVQL